MLTIEQLEKAVIALRYAADGGVFTTGDRLFVEAAKPLEAEIERLKDEQLECPSCDVFISTTNDHLSWCKAPNWLPAEASRLPVKKYSPAFLECLKAEPPEGGE